MECTTHFSHWHCSLPVAYIAVMCEVPLQGCSGDPCVLLGPSPPPPLPQDQPTKYKQMVPTFVNLLQSALGRRLPKEMEYHGVPAPWAQIRLLKILAMLGADDPRWAGRLEPD